MRLFDLNKDGKMSGLEKAVELAWLADSLEAAHEAQGDRKSAGPAPTLDEGPESKPVSNPIAVSLVVVALLFGALFTMGVIGAVFVGAGAFYFVAIASGIILVALIVTLMVFANT